LPAAPITVTCSDVVKGGRKYSVSPVAVMVVVRGIDAAEATVAGREATERQATTSAPPAIAVVIRCRFNIAGFLSSSPFEVIGLGASDPRP
jgi:hypothetical protein